MVKNHESTRYSGLDQANASNVAAWRVAMGALVTFLRKISILSRFCYSSIHGSPGQAI